MSPRKSILSGQSPPQFQVLLDRIPALSMDFWSTRFHLPALGEGEGWIDGADSIGEVIDVKPARAQKVATGCCKVESPAEWPPTHRGDLGRPRAGTQSLHDAGQVGRRQG